MNFTYVCNGISTAADGSFPRVTVLVTASDDDIPPTLTVPTVEITVPIAAKRLAQSLSSIAADAVQLARQLLNESQLADWVTAQSGPPQG